MISAKIIICARVERRHYATCGCADSISQRGELFCVSLDESMEFIDNSTLSVTCSNSCLLGSQTKNIFLLLFVEVTLKISIKLGILENALSQ